LSVPPYLGLFLVCVGEVDVVAVVELELIVAVVAVVELELVVAVVAVVLLVVDVDVVVLLQETRIETRAIRTSKTRRKCFIIHSF
jgi:hypothetical protein